MLCVNTFYYEWMQILKYTQFVKSSLSMALLLFILSDTPQTKWIVFQTFLEPVLLQWRVGEMLVVTSVIVLHKPLMFSF